MTEHTATGSEQPSGPLPALPTPFALTDAAMRRIAYLLSDEPVGTRFWVMVEGGGCSGFQYRFDLNMNAPQPGDFLIEQEGARVAVDEMSLPMLEGSVLDYVEDLASAGFEIKNPKAGTRCGCGNSFSPKF